ncbi:MAG: hypothetical protein JSW02_02855 [candidate division WOR-3 bacterium]|nr:MAG: hypothetical protein JSW02_02855 [candidate division WOR-3 bacterium]
MQRVLIKLGRMLFRYRAVIAVPFFVALVILSRPTTKPLAGCILLLAGLGIRLWAAGYIGTRGRTHVFRTEYRIINGPYQMLRHPLYIGNFLLVLGVTLLYGPPLWYAFLTIVSYITVYTLIASSESWHLRERPEMRVAYRFVNLRGEVSTMICVCTICILYLILRFL